MDEEYVAEQQRTKRNHAKTEEAAALRHYAWRIRCVSMPTLDGSRRWQQEDVLEAVEECDRKIKEIAKQIERSVELPTP
jgi:hypothetical protein